MFRKIGKKSTALGWSNHGYESGHTGILPDMKLASRRVETGYSWTVFPNALSMKSMSA